MIDDTPSARKKGGGGGRRRRDDGEIKTSDESGAEGRGEDGERGRKRKRERSRGFFVYLPRLWRGIVKYFGTFLLRSTR